MTTQEIIDFAIKEGKEHILKLTIGTHVTSKECSVIEFWKILICSKLTKGFGKALARGYKILDLEIGNETKAFTSQRHNLYLVMNTALRKTHENTCNYT